MKHAAIVSSLIVSLALSLYGQQGPSSTIPLTSSSQAVTLLAAALQKIGALTSVQDVSADVTITSADPSQPVVTGLFRFLGADQFRSEDNNGNPFLIAHNDVVSIDGEPKWFSLKSFSPVWSVFPWLTITSDSSHGQLQTTTDSTSGTAISVIRQTLDGIPGNSISYKVYIDSTTGLIQRITYDKAAPSNLRDTVPAQISFSDYRQIAGLLVPFQIVEKIHGQLVSTTQVNAFTFNQGLSPQAFELLPPGGQQ